MKIITCTQCGRPDQKEAAHGLCNVCYKRRTKDPEAKPTPPHEQTEAELDAMIQEQMKELPAWWNDGHIVDREPTKGEQG